MDQVGDEEEGGGGEGRDHARPVGGDATASDEDVPGAEEDRRRAVERGVDRGQPGRPSRVPSVWPVDDEGDAPDDDGGQRADDPGGEPLSRNRSIRRARRERGGLVMSRKQ